MVVAGGGNLGGRGKDIFKINNSSGSIKRWSGSIFGSYRHFSPGTKIAHGSSTILL